MKPTDPLDEILAQWKVTTAEDSSFHREVWHRIAASHDELSWTERCLNWLLKPRRMLAAATACILFGCSIGILAAVKHRTTAREMYLSSINPLDSHHPHYAVAR
jgi:hypothetical protein